MKPYSVNIVCDYIIKSLNADDEMMLINLKLQKLLYYVQAWSLGILKERFIDTKFEAWVHGPVCRDLYNRFKTNKTLYSLISVEDITNDNPEKLIEEDDIKFIDFILENYAGFSGVELEAMTHNERPWKETRTGLSPMESCNKEIEDDLMKTYYGEKWETINS